MHDKAYRYRDSRFEDFTDSSIFVSQSKWMQIEEHNHVVLRNFYLFSLH
jgi:hypothetical protein